MYQGTVFFHTSRIYIYLIESPSTVKRVDIFQFIYTLILIRQKNKKILLFKRKSFWIEGERWIPTPRSGRGQVSWE